MPKTIEERLKVANDFVNDYKFEIPVLVDEMDNNFDHHYAAWPERFYIVNNNSVSNLSTLAHIGKPTLEFGYDRTFIPNWIQNYISVSADLANN